MAKATREALQRETARYLSMFGGGTETTTPAVWAPAMDVWETDDEIVYAFDLPGIAEDTVSIKFYSGELEVHVKKPESETPDRIQVGNDKTAIEGKATDGQDPMRVPKGLDRLLWHCELVHSMTALPDATTGGERLGVS